MKTCSFIELVCGKLYILLHKTKHYIVSYCLASVASDYFI